MRCMRPESSVTLLVDEWGGFVFPCELPGKVIHRTPEELGLPRTVPDVAVQQTTKLRPDFVDYDTARGRKRLQELHAGKRKDWPVRNAG